MNTPAIVVNFKAYSQVCGEAGLELAKICEQVAFESKHSIVVSPQMVDLALTIKNVNIPVFAQHVDNAKVGSSTGHVTPESVTAWGASGTLINHSENRLKLSDIEELIRRSQKLNLETIVCTNNLAVTKAVAQLNPNYVAIEPPELIGGDISVTSSDPEIVKQAVDEVLKINPKVGVLCGAGVKTGEDVRKAIELGTDGVLLASGVTKATDPKSALLELLSGLD